MQILAICTTLFAAPTDNDNHVAGVQCKQHCPQADWSWAKHMEEGAPRQSSAIVIALAGLAFLFNSVWLNLMGYGPITIINGSFDYARYIYLCICIVSSIVFAIISQKPQFNLIHTHQLIWVIAFLGTILLLIPSSVIGTVRLILAGLGFTVVAVGGIWNILTIYSLYKDEGSLFQVALTLSFANAAMIPIYEMVQSFLPRTAQIVIALICCFLAFLSLFIAYKHIEMEEHYIDFSDISQQMDTVNDSAYDFSVSSAMRNYRTEFAYLFGAAVVVVSMYGLGSNGIWGASHDAMLPDRASIASLVTASIIFLACAGVLFRYTLVWYRGTRQIQLLFLVLIAGFLALVSFESINATETVQRTFTAVLTMFGHTLGVFIVIYCARQLPYPAFFTGGIFGVADHVLALLWTLFLEELRLGSSIGALFATYVFILLVSLYDTKSSKQNTETPGQSNVIHEPGELTDPYAMIFAKRDQISLEYGLTPRESEVLGYLLQGRSLPFIADELCLSAGTIKTHIRHLYQKLEIHSKQELINLVNDGTASPIENQ